MFEGGGGSSYGDVNNTARTTASASATANGDADADASGIGMYAGELVF
jgi:hypothetical protein